MGSLSDKVAIITGAGQGVGQGIALALASDGVKRWADNNPEAAEEFRGTIPLGYIGDCEEDIGRAVVALVQPAMRHLTGATVPLDGGQANFG